MICWVTSCDGFLTLACQYKVYPIYYMASLRELIEDSERWNETRSKVVIIYNNTLFIYQKGRSNRQPEIRYLRIHMLLAAGAYCGHIHSM